MVVAFIFVIFEPTPSTLPANISRGNLALFIVPVAILHWVVHWLLFSLSKMYSENNSLCDLYSFVYITCVYTHTQFCSGSNIRMDVSVTVIPKTKTSCTTGLFEGYGITCTKVSIVLYECTSVVGLTKKMSTTETSFRAKNLDATCDGAASLVCLSCHSNIVWSI